MKKSIIAAALAGVMLLTGCSGVSEESYNAVVAENEKLKSENSSLKSENSSLQSENHNLAIEVSAGDDLLKEYGEKIYELQQQLQSQTDSGSEPSTPEFKYTKVYDDEFIKISYVGIGKGASYPYENRECVIFYIENKTDTTYEFLPDSLSFDDVDVGKLACYTRVAPKSTGKIYMIKMSNTDQYFENKSPSKISGELSVKDYSDLGIFGDNWWHSVSFVNIEI